jgi:hypothetical protein
MVQFFYHDSDNWMWFTICGIIGTILSFLPIMTDSCFNLSGSSLQESLDSETYRSSIIAIIIASVSMFIDLVLDGYTHYKRFSCPKESKAFKYWFGRVIFALSIIIPFGYLNSLPSLSAGLFLNIYTSFRSLWVMTLLYCLHVADSKIFTLGRSLFTGISFVFLGLLRLYHICRPANNRLRDAYILFFCTSFLSEFCFICLWLWKVCSAKFANWRSDDYCILIYLLALFLSSTSSFFISSTKGYNFSNVDSYDLRAINYGIVATIMLVTSIPGKISREELLATRDALIASKKSYVRYISHELRTPLNTSFLGLKLLMDEFGGSDSPR